MLSETSHKKAQKAQQQDEFGEIRQNSFCAFCASLWQTGVQMPSGVEFDASTPSLP
jgi:hypothetical protein